MVPNHFFFGVFLDDAPQKFLFDGMDDTSSSAVICQVPAARGMFFSAISDGEEPKHSHGYV